MSTCSSSQKVRFQLRRATVAQWTANNPILLAGEPALSMDTNQLKIGDGITSWINLPYINVQGVAGQIGTPTSLLPAATLVPVSKNDTLITATLPYAILENQGILFTTNIADSGTGGTIVGGTLYYAFANYSTVGSPTYIQVKTSVAGSTPF